MTSNGAEQPLSRPRDQNAPNDPSAHRVHAGCAISAGPMGAAFGCEESRGLSPRSVSTRPAVSVMKGA